MSLHSKRSTGKSLPLFLRHGRDVAILHCSVLIFSYLLVFLYYPSLINEAEKYSYLKETFLIFLFISIPLSVVLLFQKSSFGTLVILVFRCYLIMVQGYSMGGFFSIKLILGIGLLCETAVLPEKPFNALFSGLFTAALVFGQIYNPVFGHHRYIDRELYGSGDVLLTMTFVFGIFAAALNLLVFKSDRREEMWENLKLQKESMKALAEFNSDLQSYARKIDIESSVRERNRISREIHDISGYIFTNLIALLNAACSILQEDQNSLSDILITARKQAREGLKETRIALRKTREVRVPEEEGVRAINKIITIFEKVTGVKVSVYWGNTPNSFSRDLNFALYRTVQEALTNAIRHGLATEIAIHFLIQDSVLRMIITDNGQGAESVVKGIGLTGMEERIGNLGGNIQVSNAPEGGFSLTVEVPLPNRCLSQGVDQSAILSS